MELKIRQRKMSRTPCVCIVCRVQKLVSLASRKIKCWISCRRMSKRNEFNDDD